MSNKDKLYLYNIPSRIHPDDIKPEIAIMTDYVLAQDSEYDSAEEFIDNGGKIENTILHTAWTIDYALGSSSSTPEERAKEFMDCYNAKVESIRLRDEK